MIYKDFYNKWLGRRVDVDGQFGYQCVDLVKAYIRDCFGIPNGAYGDAIKWWTQTKGAILAKFWRVEGSAAVQGDIVIFRGINGNVYGHIGVATGGLTSSAVEVLEQNGATGNGSGTGGDAIRKRYIARSRVAGLLRPKTSTPPLPAPGKWEVGNLVWLKGNVQKWRVYRPGVQPKTGREIGSLAPYKFWNGPNGQRGLTYVIRELTPYPNTVGIDSRTYGRCWIYLDSDAQKV